MKESYFQSKVKRNIQRLLPGSIVFKTPANFIQGFPDLLILYKKHWAALECKISEKASHRPNQDFWVKKLNEMSFASFIFPENERKVLNDLQQAFKS